MNAYLAIDQDPLRVIYRQDDWPEDLYRVRDAGPEDAGLMPIESLFKEKSGKPYPLLSGFFDPDFLAFYVYRPRIAAGERKGA